VFCSIALVLLTRGSIEAHFHFFVIIGFIALYQDWVPFLWNVAFTVLSHGLGTVWLGGGQIFNHPAAQEHPWVWSFVHGVAVFAACIGMVLFWRITEEEQEGRKALLLVTAGAEAEIGRRRLTSDLLVNLARRNQSMLYRQLDIINQLENKERDPDALSDLFRIDHLATRIRRNAESLLVLAGEQPPRTWTAPVALRDVVRAAIAETEDLDRVVFAVDDRVSVCGTSVADLTHLIAELTENAVRFSPPETVVTIRARPNRREDGGQLLTIEDWGVGMPPDDLAEANDLLVHPREIDASVSQRLGFHVVARLAARHGIGVSLTATPGSGITAVALLPSALFTTAPAVAELRPSDPDPAETTRLPVTGQVPEEAALDDPEQARAETVRGTDVGPVHQGRPALPVSEPVMPPPVAERDPMVGSWSGWWMPEPDAADGHGANGTAPARNGHTNGHTNGHVNGHTNGHVNGHANGHVNGHANGHGPAPVPAPAVEHVPDSPPPAAVEERPAVDELVVVEELPIVDELPVLDEPATIDEPGTIDEPDEIAAPVATGLPRIPAPTPPPDPGRPPLTTVPHPRTDEPAAAPRTAAPGARGRSLNRRVPQTHLAPELRLAANGLADTAATAAPDAAASALSRYQASRRAAQAVVGTADAHPGEGARA
jgi:signal transduction histidine kinase